MPLNAYRPDAGAIARLRALFPRFASVPADGLETLLRRTGAHIVEDRPRDFIYRKGIPAAEISCLISGWATRYIVLSDGRRQILAFKTPGSFVCVHALCTEHLPFSVQALTPTRRIAMDIDALIDTIREIPEVRQIFYAIGCHDLAAAEDKMTGLGRRDASEKISRLILKLYAMLRPAGLADTLTFEFPLRQNHIADSTGLTTVHVNRILRQFRKAQIITLDKGMVEIHDLDALLELADLTRAELDVYQKLPRGWDRLMVAGNNAG